MYAAPVWLVLFVVWIQERVKKFLSTIILMNKAVRVLTLPVLKGTFVTDHLIMRFNKVGLNIVQIPVHLRTRQI